MTTAPAPRVLFIGGSGRSGTSIMKEILSLHPDVATLPFEYRFIIDPDGIADFYATYPSSWTPYLADRRLKRLLALLELMAREPWPHRWLSRLLRRVDRRGRWLTPHRYAGWQLEAHLPGFRRHLDRLRHELVTMTFAATWVGTESYARRPHLHHAPAMDRARLQAVLGGFVTGVIGDLLAASGRTLYVEDNTFNVLLARELLELVPGGRILHVYRDPRDVVASFVRQRWCPSAPGAAARWHRDIMAHWRAVRSGLPTGTVLEVSLEALVAAPEPTLRRVAAFAGLTFDPRLLAVDLSGAHLGRWRRDFDATAAALVTAELGDLLEEFGAAGQLAGQA